MKKEYQDIEQLERYQKGECTDKEKREVETRLAQDEEFRGMFDDMELMVLGLRRTSSGSSIEDKIELLKGSLEVLEEDEEKDVIDMKSWFSRNRTSLSVAASIVLLVSSIFIFDLTGNKDPDSLFQDYFEPYTNLNSALRDGEQEVDDISQAYAAYELGKYEEAARLFESANAKNIELMTHLFYQGNAYLAIGEAEKAISLFILVSESESLFKGTAKWYLALSYLQNGNIEKTKELLTEVQNSGTDFKRQAEELLEKLN